MRKKAVEVPENPLVPHAVLRRMYDVMVAIRSLEPKVAAVRQGVASRRGEEACRASSLLSCEAGDLISDAAGGGMLEQVLPGWKAGRKEAAKKGPTWLPDGGSGSERLLAALGAAAALRSQQGRRLVLVYVGATELKAAQWERALGLAGGAELPLLIVVLPGGAMTRQGWLSDRAQGWGVPGMPVDAGDAVALYRVMQESVARARGGDGPALLECVAWRPQGRAVARTDDVAGMRRLLLERGIAVGRG